MRFAETKFASYYKKAQINVERVEQKEFGFGDFEQRILRRHRAFKSQRDLDAYLAAAAPPSISVSTAFYKYPDGRPMEAKGWLGSELVFDLDSSDLNLECQKTHGRSWVCPNCLAAVKMEVFKLIENFLVPDFAVPKKDISINFSGNRGYHLHVSDLRFLDLTTKQRTQITGYITAKEIDLNVFFPALGEKGKQLRGPKPTDKGWGGKLARGTISALNAGEDALVRLGIDSQAARKLVKKKADVILGITMGNWDRIGVPKKAEFWGNVLKGMTISQTSLIDRNVTNGTEHLIRLPNTIHSDTGLCAMRLGSVDELEKFDPMKEAVLFRAGAVRVYIEKSQPLEIGGMLFGPFEKQRIELPTYAALYLLLKRVAVLSD